MPLGLSLGLMRSRSLKPALDLNLTSGFLDSRITFSRGSNATLVDATGKIVYAPANLLVYSEQFDNAAWTKDGATITANSMVAPDGTTTADTITGVSGNFRAYQAVTVANGTTYTMSAFVKQGTSPTIGLDFLNVVAGPIFTFATASWSTVGGWTTSVQALANGWYRITASYLSNTTFAGPAWRVSGTTTAFIWGAQLEPVTYQTTPSPYVATTASAYYGPRFDYDPVTLAPKGLLIEEARTNLLTYSDQFDNAAWIKLNATVTANGTASPDGTTNADKLVEDATNSVHIVYQGPAFAGSTTYTVSLFAKAAERSKLDVFCNGISATATNLFEVTFDLSNGTFLATQGTATITPFGNGWYRCTVTNTYAVIGTSANIQLRLNNGTTTSYAGTPGFGMFLWGAGLEAGSFATSYIPTVASTVTRSADVATMTGTNFSSWYNQSAGTLVCEFDTNTLSASGTSVYSSVFATDGTANNYNGLYTYSGFVGGVIRTGAVNQADINGGGSPVNNTTIKAAITYATDNIAVAVNGATPVTDTSAAIGITMNQLNIGNRNGNNYRNGHIRQIAYYNTRLPNAQLQTLTAPSLATTLSLSFTNQAYTVGV